MVTMVSTTQEKDDRMILELAGFREIDNVCLPCYLHVVALVPVFLHELMCRLQPGIAKVRTPNMALTMMDCFHNSCTSYTSLWNIHFDV